MLLFIPPFVWIQFVLYARQETAECPVHDRAGFVGLCGSIVFVLTLTGLRFHIHHSGRERQQLEYGSRRKEVLSGRESDWRARPFFRGPTRRARNGEVKTFLAFIYTRVVVCFIRIAHAFVASDRGVRTNGSGAGDHVIMPAIRLVLRGDDFSERTAFLYPALKHGLDTALGIGARIWDRAQHRRTW